MIIHCDGPEGDSGLPYEPNLQGNIVVCTRCKDGDPSRSPLFPSWFMPRHDAWHDGLEARSLTAVPEQAKAS